MNLPLRYLSRESPFKLGSCWYDIDFRQDWEDTGKELTTTKFNPAFCSVCNYINFTPLYCNFKDSSSINDGIVLTVWLLPLVPLYAAKLPGPVLRSNIHLMGWWSWCIAVCHPSQRWWRSHMPWALSGVLTRFSHMWACSWGFADACLHFY
jgi:hypothetical protein